MATCKQVRGGYYGAGNKHGYTCKTPNGVAYAHSVRTAAGWPVWLLGTKCTPATTVAVFATANQAFSAAGHAAVARALFGGTA